MIRKNILNCILLFFVLFLCCCHSDTGNKDADKIAKYIFLGHTYNLDYDGQKIDLRAEKINYENYRLVLLGGDITAQTTNEYSNLTYVDSIFNLGNERTLWTVGNHDYSHPEYIFDFTNRPLHYAFHKNAITILVLNSQSDSCNIVGNQLEMLKHVADTIQKSSHLVILLHKLIWLSGHSELEKSDSISNGGIGQYNWSIYPNNFYNEVYPLLLEVKKRGIEVLCISGDIGIYSKEFEYKTEDGIIFLASGLSRHADANDKVLILSHDIYNRTLTWDFVLINELTDD